MCCNHDKRQVIVVQKAKSIRHFSTIVQQYGAESILRKRHIPTNTLNTQTSHQYSVELDYWFDKIRPYKTVECFLILLVHHTYYG